MASNNVKYTTSAKLLYHVVAFMEGYNLDATAACMCAFETSLGLSASRLSIIYAVEKMSLLGIGAVWGVLMDMAGRKCNHVCTLGMLLCGMGCILLGCTSSYPMILFCRFLHGGGLSCVTPVYSKIIEEDTTLNKKKSLYQGLANGVHCLGKVVSLFLVTRFATRNLMGQYGWRLCYCLVGYLWLIMALPVYCKMTKTETSNTASSTGGTQQQGKPYYTKATFWVMGLVRYASEVPFVILGFMVMYFQYSGLSNKMAGIVVAVVQVGAVAGSSSGGYLVDACHNKWKKEKGYGRLTFAMGVLFIRLLCIMLILWWPIHDGALRWYHWAELFVFGVTLFVASAVDRPIVTDVSKGKESLALSIYRVIGGVTSSATLSPVIGLLAEKKFGYVKTTEMMENMSPETKMGNVNALRMSLISVGTVLTVVNMICYIPVFFTYEGDNDNKNDAKNQ